MTVIIIIINIIRTFLIYTGGYQYPPPNSAALFSYTIDTCVKFINVLRAIKQIKAN